MGSTESTEQRAPGRAVAWIAASAVALIAGTWISIPGMDTEVLAAAREYAGMPSDLGVAMAPVLGMSVWVLVGARIVLAAIGKAESAPARVIALAICLAVTAVQTFSIAVWAESASYSMPFGDLVHEPGWRFRLTGMVTSAAGVALAWWLADRIDATRAASGALAFAFLASLVRLLGEARACAQALSTGESGPLSALIVLALPASMLIVAVALAVRTPRWPVKIVRGLELRSGFDAVAAPCVLATFSWVAGTVTPSIVHAGVVIATSIALVALLRRGERGPGRALWPLAPAMAALVLALAPLTYGLVSSDALSRALEPGPLEGEASFTITLGATDRFREGEARAMIDHLNDLGARAELVSADAQRITIRLENASAPDAVTDALRPRTLALHLVGEPPSEGLPAGVRPPSSYERGAEGPCSIVEEWAPSVACATGIERIRDELDDVGAAEPSRCRLYCLEPPAIITAEDIAGAHVVTDAYDNRPIVSATLTEAAAERFGRVTAENIDRQLAIVLDGEVVSAPVIRSAIPGGRIQITMGGFGSFDETLADANALVTALRAGRAITSEWTLESIE